MIKLDFYLKHLFFIYFKWRSVLFLNVFILFTYDINKSVEWKKL